MLDATPLLRLYAAFRRKQLAAEDPAKTQEAQLLRLIRQAQGTPFGARHDFPRLHSVADFQAAVPLRTYEEFWREYWQAHFPRLGGQTWPEQIPYLAVTSGTTSGKTKYIPVSWEMVASNRRAVLDMFTHHLTHRPRSRVLGGRNFMLGGSVALKQEASGIWSGDLSGIAAKEVPFWARPRYFPPLREAQIPDWDAKIAHLAQLSLKADIRTISGTPSWLLLFFDKLAELMPGSSRRLAAYYPNLELLAHGGVNFAPYRSSFERLLEGSHAELREVYPASEGFVAVADRGSGEGLRMILDNGIFYEFVPLEELRSAKPIRHWIGNAEPGVNYALVLTSCAGLWSYILGDTVKLVDRTPPRLLVTGRTTYMLSAFGEHLLGTEIEEAVAAAAEEIGTAVNDFTVAPLYPKQEDERGGHLFIVEFSGDFPSEAALADFAQRLDRCLAERNDDYAAHRTGMRAPQIYAVPAGSFAGWMRFRGRLGGQNKVPRVITDPELLGSLQAYLDRG